MSPESPLASEISLADLIEMVGDDTETLREIVESFLDDSPQLIAAMFTGLNDRDAELTERSAHTIKSSSRLFQAEQFANLCQAIEDAAREENWDQLSPMVNELQADYEVIAQTLLSKLEQI